MPTTRRPDPAEERAAREARRLQAAELFALGHSQAEVARDLGVSRQAVSVWHASFTQGGLDALRSRGPTGPDPKLSAAQLAQVEQEIVSSGDTPFPADPKVLAEGEFLKTQLSGIQGTEEPRPLFKDAPVTAVVGGFDLITSTVCATCNDGVDVGIGHARNLCASGGEAA